MSGYGHGLGYSLYGKSYLYTIRLGTVIIMRQNRMAMTSTVTQRVDCKHKVEFRRSERAETSVSCDVACISYETLSWRHAVCYREVSRLVFGALVGFWG